MTIVRMMSAATAGLLAILAATQASAIGRLVLVDGTVNVRSADGSTRTARQGETVNSGDSITLAVGRAQVRFDDGGWISLEPRTDFRVDEYGRIPTDNIVLALLKGSVRAVTGALTAAAPRNYRLRTPVAYIGIRGTSFLVTFCQQSCDVPDGLYVTCGDGQIYVENEFGELDLSPGMTAYVANARTAPVESTIRPLSVIPGPTTGQVSAAAQTTMSAQAATAQAQVDPLTPIPAPGDNQVTALTSISPSLSPLQIFSAAQATTSELRPGNYVYFAGTSGYATPFQTLQPASGGFGLAGSGSIAGQAFGVVDGIPGSSTGSGAGANFAAGAGTLQPGNSLTVVLDGSQRLVSLTGGLSTGERASITVLGVPQIAANDGVLFWGRWNNTSLQVDVTNPARGTASGTANFGAGSYLHYIGGLPIASVPLAGAATYTFLAGSGSGSTSAAGVVGSGVVGGTLNVNFGTNFVSTNLGISHGSPFAATGAAFLDASNRANFSSIFGNATGPAGTFPFEFKGFLVGPGSPTAPSRAAMTWKVDAPDPFIGTAGFTCLAGC
jgi:hypothetical protein